MAPQSVDWFTVLWDIIQHGHNLSDIDRQTGIYRNTLRRYLEGAQPPHWRGELLIGMWCEVCKRGRDQLPMCKVYIAPRVVPEPDRVTMSSEVGRELMEVWR